MRYQVVSNANRGELLGESLERRGADIMAELFQLRGIACRVVAIGEQRKALSRYARLRVELLERR